MSAQPVPLNLPPAEPETPADAGQVAALVDAAFGPGRHAKTAERLREASAPACGLVMRDDGRLVGSVRLWRIRVGETAALFLGPIAVEAGARKAGLGAALVQSSLACAAREGVGGVLLVGDLPYFGRFGFRELPGARMPGPVDPRRLLWRALSVEAPDGAVVGVCD
ncbi:MAG: N-acetyltransferase [Alphaproteobacteria bacterium]|nr:N-acetyltransferase [Alphaproteobacteria bacterium]MBU1526163.1 N-acetyltransferase [Alphaproteobacteria bacterium]MBU2117418.1 N-acetyltransferase [Alphaproteobacteria bacterium]MBU2350515.1 N-acetyltransferase [Alphaproteobacteria bacterium]MBU2380980.1 N-acetyltransferase [Alphaproteobacteria bacterium]